MASSKLGEDARKELDRWGGQHNTLTRAIIGLDEDRELLSIFDQWCEASNRLCGQSPISVARRHRSQSFELSRHALISSRGLYIMHSSMQTK